MSVKFIEDSLLQAVFYDFLWPLQKSPVIPILLKTEQKVQPAPISKITYEVEYAT